MGVRPDYDDVETEAEFQLALETLLEDARRNGITVVGGWECRTDDAGHDWDVTIETLVKPTG